MDMNGVFNGYFGGTFGWDLYNEIGTLWENIGSS